MNDTAELYWECHVTVKPPSTDHGWRMLEEASALHGFKVATFEMIKAESPQPEAFTSARSKSLVDISVRMTRLIEHIIGSGFKVVRYKLEGTVCDSKFQGDFLQLIPTAHLQFLSKGTLDL